MVIVQTLKPCLHIARKQLWSVCIITNHGRVSTLMHSFSGKQKISIYMREKSSSSRVTLEWHISRIPGRQSEVLFTSQTILPYTVVYSKILNRDWFSPRLFVGARSCGCPTTVIQFELFGTNWIPTWFARQLRALLWLPSQCFAQFLKLMKSSTRVLCCLQGLSQTETLKQNFIFS